MGQPHEKSLVDGALSDAIEDALIAPRIFDIDDAGGRRLAVATVARDRENLRAEVEPEA